MKYEQMILDLAVDDYVGLWELEWRANTVDPQIGPAVRCQELRHAVAALLRRGAIALYEGSHFAGEESPIQLDHALRLVDDPATWEPAGAQQSHVRAAATEAGEEEYNRVRED